jgi:hypothetical protein
MKASFCLLPSRAWELGFGGLVALLETNALYRAALSQRLRTLLGIAGLSIIFTSFFFFTSRTPFPGWTAALPVMGAAFMLASGLEGSTVSARALSIRPLVLIGLISYPMYLWHWPIIVALRQLGIPLKPWIVLATLFATAGLSVATYVYIESPIRSKRWLPTTKGILTFAAAGFITVTSLGVHFVLTDGASYRYSPVARSFLTAPFSARISRCGLEFRILHPREQICGLHVETSALRRVLLWGNSHADHWSGLFAKLASESESSFYLNARNCRATPDHEFCGNNIQERILSFIVSSRITDVALASTGYGAYGIPDDVFEKNLTDIVSRLAAIGVRTWLVIDVPAGPTLSPIIAYDANPDSPAVGSVTLSQYLKTKRREQILFDSLSHNYRNVHVIDPSLNLCNSEHCLGGKDKVIWYRDGEHLTDAGAYAASEQFYSLFFRTDKSQ